MCFGKNHTSKASKPHFWSIWTGSVFRLVAVRTAAVDRHAPSSRVHNLLLTCQKPWDARGNNVSTPHSRHAVCLYRFQGMSSMDVFQGKRAIILLAELMPVTAVLLNGPILFAFAGFTAITSIVVLRLHAICAGQTSSRSTPPTKTATSRRLLTEQLRFSKADINRLMDELHFPAKTG